MKYTNSAQTVRNLFRTKKFLRFQGRRKGERKPTFDEMLDDVQNVIKFLSEAYIDTETTLGII